MFICHFCRKSVAPRTPCNKVITKTIMFQHPHRPKVHRRWGIDKQGKPKIEWIDDKGGLGPQIAVEVQSCPECAKVFIAKREAAKQAEESKLLNIRHNINKYI